jgi:hypothetical protein
MKAIVRRVGRLEDRFQTQLAGKPKSSLRIIVARGENGAANLATSTCTRRLNNSGGLIEIVDLDGPIPGSAKRNWTSSSRAFQLKPPDMRGHDEPNRCSPS